MSRTVSVSLLLRAALAFAIPAVTAQRAPDPRVADLVRAGKLKVAVYLPQYAPDPVTGKVGRLGSVGVVMVELAKRLASPLGLEVTVDGFPTPPSVVTCLKTNVCDMALMGPDETRESDVDFSHTAIIMDYTYLVPAASPIQSKQDVDRAGVRIAGVRNHASTLALSRLLERATLITAATPDETVALLRDGRADVLVSVREALQYYYTPKLPGARLLTESYGFNNLSIAIPKGQQARLSYINEVIEEAKRSGFLADLINRLGRTGTIKVAPMQNGK